MNEEHSKLVMLLKKNNTVRRQILEFLNEEPSFSQETAMQYLISFGRICSLIPEYRTLHARLLFSIMYLSDKYSFRHEYLNNVTNLPQNDFGEFTQYTTFLKMKNNPYSQLVVEPNTAAPALFGIKNIDIRPLFYANGKLLYTEMNALANYDTYTVKLCCFVEFEENTKISMKFECISGYHKKQLKIKINDIIYNFGGYIGGSFNVDEVDNLTIDVGPALFSTNDYMMRIYLNVYKLYKRTHVDNYDAKTVYVNPTSRTQKYSNLEYIPNVNELMSIVDTDAFE